MNASGKIFQKMSGRNYTVYFEVFGKKMKTTIWAKSQESAKQQILEKIEFHKFDVVPPTQPRKPKTGNPIEDFFNGLSKDEILGK